MDQEFSEIKQQIKDRENEQTNVRYIFLSLSSYLAFQSFVIAGKINAVESYNNLIGLESLANVQFFCYYLLSPVGVILLSRLVLKMKFRIILWIGALGSIFFMLAPFLTMKCYTEDKVEIKTIFICTDWSIYIISIIISLLAGTVHSFLNFGILYYLTNISKKNEKAIFYGAFFFMHNFSLMLAGAIAQIFDDTFQKTPSEFFEVIMIILIAVSVLFLILPEGGSQQRINQFIMKIKENELKEYQKQKSQNDQIQLRKLLLAKNDDSDEDQQQQKQQLEEQEKNVSINQNKKNQSKSGSATSLPLLFFSMEEYENTETIEKIYKNESLGSKRRFFSNLITTLERVTSQNFGYIIPLIFNIALIESYGYVYLCRTVKIGTEIFLTKCEEKKSLRACEKESDGDTFFNAFFYFGIGQIFGCFAMGLLGDQKEKVSRRITTFLILLQIGCCSGLLYNLFYDFVYICICISILGFCHSSIKSSIITQSIMEYSDQIFMIDLMYCIYTLGLSFSALIFFAFNFTDPFGGIIIIQVTGVISLISFYLYQKNQNIHQNLSNLGNQ